MSQAYEVDLLHGEEVNLVAKPHPLSFLKYHLFAAYLVCISLFLGSLYSFLKSSEQLLEVLGFLDFFFGRFGMRPPEVILLVLFWLILLLSGFAVGALWISKMPLVYVVLVGLIGTALEVYFLAPFETILFQKPMVKVLLLGVSAVVGMVLTEVYRRGHAYIITNYRIIMKKGFVRKEERELMYDKITDVYVNQGVLGRLFNFGTVTPISDSGFGLGEDAAQAFAAAAVPVKQGTVGGGFAGEKSVHTPRAATYFSLYGIPNPKKVRVIIGNRQLETKEAPILRRIEGLLKDKETKEKGFGKTPI